MSFKSSLQVDVRRDKPNPHINGTDIEQLVLNWFQYKNSLKYKAGCFWRFSYVYTINKVLLIPLLLKCKISAIW